MSRSTLALLGKAGFYALLPLFFVLTPTSWLEARRPLCPVRYLFGVACPGCGLTRAISCMFHAQLGRALRYNRSVVIVLPLLSYLWLRRVAAAVVEHIPARSV